jgi:hypothetical protein
MQNTTKHHAAARKYTRRAAHCIAGRVWNSHSTYEAVAGGGARLVGSVRSSRSTFGAAAVADALRTLGEGGQA